MRIIKGEHKGSTARLHQFANDWMTVDIDGGRQGVVIKPTMVQLDAAEQERVRAAPHVGIFWSLWTLNDDGTFTAKPRPASIT